MFGIDKKEKDGILVRNCSTRSVLERMGAALGDFKHESGRYVVFGDDVTLESIRKWSNDNGFYSKVSELGPVTVVDIMVDREKGNLPMHGRIRRQRPDRRKQQEEWNPSDNND
jgi:hypothetical protein